MSLDLRIGPFVLPRVRADPSGTSIVEFLDRRAQAITQALRQLFSINYDPRSADESAPNSVISVGPVTNLHALREVAEELGAPERDQGTKPPLSRSLAHLTNHSDADGYYLPVDFPDPFWLVIFSNRTETSTQPPSTAKEQRSVLGNIPRRLWRRSQPRKDEPEDLVSVGSAAGLLRELERIGNGTEGEAARLGPTFDALYEAVQLSVERGLPLELC